MIQGDLSIEDDVDHAVTRRMLHRYEKKEEAERNLAEWKCFDPSKTKIRHKGLVKRILAR